MYKSEKCSTFAGEMKRAFGLIGLVQWLLFCVVAVWGQVVTNADCYEEGQKAVITYSLDKKANIDLQMSLNNGSFQTLSRTSLSGDVGTNVSKGKNKKIVWDVLKECNSLVGDVQFRVVPSESLDDYNKRIAKENYQRTGYPATCRGFFDSQGTWSISFADIGIGVGVLDKKAQVPIYFGLGTFRYKFVELTVIAFSWETTSFADTFSSNSYSYSSYSYSTTPSSDTKIYWEPQLRFVLPMTDRWGFVVAGGPSLDVMADYDRWSFTATGRFRYGLSLLQMDLFAGYEHRMIVAGLSLSLKWGR